MSFGQQELEGMIASQHIELCPPDTVGASYLITKARTHHSTAASLARTDPEIAADALHAGNRKALEAVTAMVGGAGTLRVYNVVRRLRHEGDYSNASSDIHPEDIEGNLNDSAELVDACEKMIPLVPPFVNGRA